MPKAIGMYIFGGSQTIGHILTGWTVDRVLEMTDNMDKINSYHFIKNYPDIPVILPNEWNNQQYIDNLKGNNYDLLFANNPCSGLSSINRNANVDNPINQRFFEVISMVNSLQPKCFLMENAPTLTKLGLPILKEISKLVNDNYRLLIINDLAGNHSVPMYRRRTLVVGWNRKYFSSIPHILKNKDNKFTVRDALSGLSDNSFNMEFDNKLIDYNLQRFYYLAKPDQTVLKGMVDNYDLIKDDLNESELKQLNDIKMRYDKKGSVWDKSSYRLNLDGLAPSMTSINQYMHPTENRDLYIREYARLMGYPDDFIFYPSECECSTMQCLAQGVPVNFIKYISTEILESLNNNRSYFNTHDDIIYINQVSNTQKVSKYSINEFQIISNIDQNNYRDNNLVQLW